MLVAQGLDNPRARTTGFLPGVIGVGETKSNGRGAVAGAAGLPADPPELAGVVSRLELLCNENEMLSGELIRSYEQLNLIFEISDQIAAYRDPEAVERTLIRRDRKSVV
jgi:hypothetical protein